jgi:hypothetical protein
MLISSPAIGVNVVNPAATVNAACIGGEHDLGMSLNTTSRFMPPPSPSAIAVRQ